MFRWTCDSLFFLLPSFIAFARLIEWLMDHSIPTNSKFLKVVGLIPRWVDFTDGSCASVGYFQVPQSKHEHGRPN